ncbi:MAG TPA: hypothetical protein VMM38_01535 [Aridibacter sp.]|nr:hypothetical protein [Aridibacter sp.]
MSVNTTIAEGLGREYHEPALNGRGCVCGISHREWRSHIFAENKKRHAYTESRDLVVEAVGEWCGEDEQRWRRFINAFRGDLIIRDESDTTYLIAFMRFALTATAEKIAAALAQAMEGVSEY